MIFWADGRKRLSILVSQFWNTACSLRKVQTYLQFIAHGILDILTLSVGFFTVPLQPISPLEGTKFLFLSMCAPISEGNKSLRHLGRGGKGGIRSD